MTRAGTISTIRARFLASPGRPVIEDAALSMQGDRIVAVGRAADLDVRGAVDYGDAVMLPGFVNAHTHLELSYLAGCVPPGRSLAEWLGRLVDRARAGGGGAEVVAVAMRDGIRQSLAAGVTCVGDITAAPRQTRPILAASPMAGVSYGEVIAIGTRRSMLTARLNAAVERDSQRDDLLIGLSPHAPYTVEPAGLRACSVAAMGLPICVHAAESPEEEDFTRAATGPLAEHLRAMGLWDDGVVAPGLGPIELLDEVGLLTERTLLAHANYVSPEDVLRIAASRASVAYCPRTHAAFGHQPHPFRALRAAGVNVCFGTDSLASNPDLSILEELRFLKARHADLDASTLLDMGTRCGALALGLAHRLGRLLSGLRADVVAVPLDADAASRWDRLFESSRPPIAVCVAGHPLTKSDLSGAASSR